ncbi:unnamed protein product [Kuraishia capsulata CBS 1993]|uniref:REJ domain-containing protein n=1 Tax=Kuraishia capsulata CBS 1993 TaxID=1382522 RepID=W6MW81_9ASCO|nr:uncharacterized protein KUCA_T00002962001 [Kuraishia capsulata CBS 1993]CDK26985.1 unnamed protein product [Kuraishia capsulata CBS 1993]
MLLKNYLYGFALLSSIVSALPVGQADAGAGQVWDLKKRQYVTVTAAAVTQYATVHVKGHESSSTSSTVSSSDSSSSSKSSSSSESSSSSSSSSDSETYTPGQEVVITSTIDPGYTSVVHETYLTSFLVTESGSSSYSYLTVTPSVTSSLTSSTSSSSASSSSSSSSSLSSSSSSSSLSSSSLSSSSSEEKDTTSTKVVFKTTSRGSKSSATATPTKKATSSTTTSSSASSTITAAPSTSDDDSWITGSFTAYSTSTSEGVCYVLYEDDDSTGTYSDIEPYTTITLTSIVATVTLTES